ncbi:MAG: BatD family protein [Vicinamibacterales bacterium]|nr:BatD family protein [Vicinamibacterales bacterium]
MVKRLIVVLGLGFGVVLGQPAQGLAQTVRAYLSQTEVLLNRQFVLNVEISGTQQLDEDPPVLPDLSAFAVYLGSGTSTSMQIVNGRTSLSLTFQHRFQATAEGTFEIGPVTVRAGGRDLRTEPLTIRITDGPAPTSRSGLPGADGTVAPEDLFITATASKPRVYVNEPVIVEYRIFTRVDVEGYNITQQPGTTGFWVEELEDPQARVEQVVRDGLQYTSAVVRRVALFPTGAGTKTLAPLTLETQVRVQRRSRSLFGDPFGGLFGSRVSVVVGSNPVEIEVLPLPEAGRPDAFTGLVGRLEVSASIDRTDAETNDALTYRLEVSGTGNIRTLPEPELGFPSDVEVYPPDVSERVDPTEDGVRGSKIFEYVIVPRAPGQVTIPAVKLAYFDIDAGTYAAAASDPITLTVAGDPVAGPAGRFRTGVDLQRQDIRFIRIAIPGFRPVGGSLVRSAGFWAIVLVPMCAVAGAVAARRHQDRLTGDVAYARRRRAARLAKQRLARAESLRSPDRHRAFHAEVGRALQGFLGDKLNLAEAGLIRDEIRARLTSRGVAPGVIDAYLGCLEDCDRQRFAPTEPDALAMQDMLTRAARAMTDLDQAL